MISNKQARRERQQRIGSFIAKLVAPEKRAEAKREMAALIPEIVKCHEIVKRNRKRRTKSVASTSQGVQIGKACT